jgi:hypothetical protein
MKKNIQRLLTVLLIIPASHWHAQSLLTVDGHQAFTSFKFVNSEGVTDKNFSSQSGGGYSLGFRVLKKGFFLRLNAGMRKAGSRVTYNLDEISWQLQYCDFRAGAGYEFDKWRIKPYFSAAPYYAIMLKASQQMDGLSYDLKLNKAIKTTDYGVFVIPGVRASLSELISIYSEYSYLIGLQNIETDTDQKLYNTGFMISIGFAATITTSKPKWIQGK